MNLNKHIKNNRERLNLSQSQLAEKIFVSRQSISNWETDKNYPDLQSLIAMSKLFKVSLDELVQSDIEIMKEKVEVGDDDRLVFSGILVVIFLLVYIILGSLSLAFHNLRMLIVALVVYLIALTFGCYHRDLLKRNHLKEYREILDFMLGSQLIVEEKQLASDLSVKRIGWYVVLSTLFAVLLLLAW